MVRKTEIDVRNSQESQGYICDSKTRAKDNINQYLQD